MGLSDPVLVKIVEYLRSKYACHTVILYGSRACAQETALSDYDVFGVSTHGFKTRYAALVEGAYWDLFVYTEKDLRKFGPQQLAWQHTQVLWQESDYAPRLLRRLHKFLAMPYKALTLEEQSLHRAWSLKQWQRCQPGDVLSNFRRTQLQVAALEDYFLLREQDYPGPRLALSYLKDNDWPAYQLFSQTYQYPDQLPVLAELLEYVYRVKPDIIPELLQMSRTE